MNDKLLKQLEIAGFPYKETKNGEIETKKGYFHENEKGKIDKFVYYPTLSELIEACGEDFNFLCRNPETGLWGAETHTGIVITNENECETAIANLWLSLQKSHFS